MVDEEKEGEVRLDLISKAEAAAKNFDDELVEILSQASPVTAGLIGMLLKQVMDSIMGKVELILSQSPTYRKIKSEHEMRKTMTKITEKYKKDKGSKEKKKGEKGEKDEFFSYDN